MFFDSGNEKKNRKTFNRKYQQYVKSHGIFFMLVFLKTREYSYFTTTTCKLGKITSAWCATELAWSRFWSSKPCMIMKQVKSTAYVRIDASPRCPLTLIKNRIFQLKLYGFKTKRTLTSLMIYKQILWGKERKESLDYWSNIYIVATDIDLFYFPISFQRHVH